MKDMRDATCDLCEASVWDLNWSLHELGVDEWRVVCEPCEETLDLDYGK